MKHALLPDSPRSPGPRRWPRTALGYGLALVCLYWVLRDLDLGELLRRVASMNLLLLAAAILFNVLSYVFQGLRWKLLLRPVGTITVLRTTQAIYAGDAYRELSSSLTFDDLASASSEN